MDISGINDKIVNNRLQEAKNKVTQDDFESRLKTAMDSKDEQELKKVCKDFEGIILGMMYKQMKATVQKSDLLPGDIGRDVYESMLDEKMVEEASKGNGAGLSDVLYRQLSRQLKSAVKASEKGDSEVAEEK